MNSDGIHEESSCPQDEPPILPQTESAPHELDAGYDCPSKSPPSKDTDPVMEDTTLKFWHMRLKSPQQKTSGRQDQSKQSASTIENGRRAVA